MSSPSSARIGRPVDQAKRAAILDAACAHFFGSGYAATSIEQIAQAAGVSKVTVYSHFGDKPSLFAASVEQECERMRGYFSIEDISNQPLRERLTAIGEAMVAFLARPEMIGFERRIAAETVDNPELGVAFLEAGPHRMRGAFAAMLTAMKERGEVDIDDPALAAEQFASMCKGFGDLENRFGRPRDIAREKERIGMAVEVFCRAYGTGD